MKYLLLAVLMVLPSCGLYSSMKDVVDRLDVSTAKVDVGLEGIQTGLISLGDKGKELASTVQEARVVVASADVDKNGAISGISEWAALLTGLLGLLGIGAAARVNGKRRANAQTFFGQIANLKERVVASEARASPA